MKKIKKGDRIVVISGKDKGKISTVKKVLDQKVIVDGVNLVKKHVKANPQLGTPGGIVEKEAAISISNIAIYNSETNSKDRIKISDIDGKKVRQFKSTGKPLAE